MQRRGIAELYGISFCDGRMEDQIQYNGNGTFLDAADQGSISVILCGPLKSCQE